MSQRERATTPEADHTSSVGRQWTCQYCGREFAPASRSREAYDLLVSHIRRDCPDVPQSVRARFRGRCAGGNCTP